MLLFSCATLVGASILAISTARADLKPGWGIVSVGGLVSPDVYDPRLKTYPATTYLPLAMPIYMQRPSKISEPKGTVLVRTVDGSDFFIEADHVQPISANEALGGAQIEFTVTQTDTGKTDKLGKAAGLKTVLKTGDGWNLSCPKLSGDCLVTQEKVDEGLIRIVDGSELNKQSLPPKNAQALDTPVFLAGDPSDSFLVTKLKALGKSLVESVDSNLGACNSEIGVNVQGDVKVLTVADVTIDFSRTIKEPGTAIKNVLTNSIGPDRWTIHGVRYAACAGSEPIYATVANFILTLPDGAALPFHVERKDLLNDVAGRVSPIFCSDEPVRYQDQEGYAIARIADYQDYYRLWHFVRTRLKENIDTSGLSLDSSAVSAFLADFVAERFTFAQEDYTDRNSHDPNAANKKPCT